MNLDELLTPHPDRQRSYHELREEFRAIHLEHLRGQMCKHPVGWGVIPDGMARDHYSNLGWALELRHRLDEPCSQDFGLNSVPFPLSQKIEEQAQKALMHEQVTWDDSTEGVRDHDAPACDPVEGMTDDQLCDYIQKSIEASRD